MQAVLHYAAIMSMMRQTCSLAVGTASLCLHGVFVCVKGGEQCRCGPALLLVATRWRGIFLYRLASGIIDSIYLRDGSISSALTYQKAIVEYIMM